MIRDFIYNINPLNFVTISDEEVYGLDLSNEQYECCKVRCIYKRIFAISLICFLVLYVYLLAGELLTLKFRVSISQMYDLESIYKILELVSYIALGVSISCVFAFTDIENSHSCRRIVIAFLMTALYCVAILLLNNLLRYMDVKQYGFSTDWVEITSYRYIILSDLCYVLGLGRYRYLFAFAIEMGLLLVVGNTDLCAELLDKVRLFAGESDKEMEETITPYLRRYAVSIEKLIHSGRIIMNAMKFDCGGWGVPMPDNMSRICKNIESNINYLDKYKNREVTGIIKAEKTKGAKMSIDGDEKKMDAEIINLSIYFDGEQMVFPLYQISLDDPEFSEIPGEERLGRIMDDIGLGGECWLHLLTLNGHAISPRQFEGGIIE